MKCDRTFHNSEIIRNFSIVISVLFHHHPPFHVSKRIFLAETFLSNTLLPKNWCGVEQRFRFVLPLRLRSSILRKGSLNLDQRAELQQRRRWRERWSSEVSSQTANWSDNSGSLLLFEEILPSLRSIEDSAFSLSLVVGFHKISEQYL